jgi:hypothetical protein
VPAGSQIIAVERVLIAVAHLERAKRNWAGAGFALAPDTRMDGGLEIARMAAGAVEIDLVGLANRGGSSALSQSVRTAIANGGGIVGWTWGVGGRADDVPHLSGSGLRNVFTSSAEVSGDSEIRRARLLALCGANPNTVTYLEHIVVMTPVLEDAIAALETIGVPCKRIREVGNGVRQAFFKLEETVLEVVGPGRGPAGCWGFALMCGDIHRAVAHARAAGLEATEPKAAIQGGFIARIVEPLDGVAVAYMAPGPRRDT